MQCYCTIFKRTNPANIVCYEPSTATSHFPSMINAHALQQDIAKPALVFAWFLKQGEPSPNPLHQQRDKDTRAMIGKILTDPSMEPNKCEVHQVVRVYVGARARHDLARAPVSNKLGKGTLQAQTFQRCADACTYHAFFTLLVGHPTACA